MLHLRHRNQINLFFIVDTFQKSPFLYVAQSAGAAENTDFIFAQG